MLQYLCYLYINIIYIIILFILQYYLYYNNIYIIISILTFLYFSIVLYFYIFCCFSFENLTA